jgi:hypothetical protein
LEGTLNKPTQPDTVSSNGSDSGAIWPANSRRGLLQDDDDICSASLGKTSSKRGSLQYTFVSAAILLLVLVSPLPPLPPAGGEQWDIWVVFQVLKQELLNGPVTVYWFGGRALSV